MWRVLKYILGALLLMVGLLPFGNFVWFLVLLPGPANIPVQLEFWQTQAIGLGLAMCGAGLIYSNRYRKPRQSPDRT